ncbi:calpain-like cysteine peptidase [Trypanosoma rangeli]|uniref:Calpain-like cysteine peptidase n=1 Tax=Trypanosoma rangeli TaxID=5698 RepID=A0A422MUY0_TRYRA|nr:calpain-like cysteine peptidase [Trypanosoma rangeli]RNE97042.1 calpain-like cysteine peptidase [Trypanosoma rangeli]|eukprot:RNE97042.1 calpain-like cysteine peptidase [Trypanosoma rangeli]
MGCVASKPKGADNGFLNGQPSETFPYDNIHKCTERDNGLLFRLVNTKTKQWAFYNDSKIYEFHVTVNFSNQSNVSPLGDTTIVRDPNDGRMVAKTIVYPRLTELFVQGDVDGFDAEYQAVVLTDEYKKKKAQLNARKRNANSNDDLEEVQ